jgi:sulfite reductase alpha subunit-like flavoprotein
VVTADADLIMSICAAYLSAKASGLSADAALRTVHTRYESVPIEMAEYVVFSALVLFPVAKALEMEVVCRPGSKPASVSSRALYTGAGTKPDDRLSMLQKEDVLSRCIASFKDSVDYQHRPDLPDTIEFVVKKNVRLTSDSYYRDVFHIELQPRDPSHKLDYLPGMVLNIYPKNNPARVDSLLSELGVDGNQFAARLYKARSGQMMEEINTVSHYLSNVLDVFGCPKPSFYRALIEYTENPMAGSLLAAYADNYEAAVDEALTYADVLIRFKESVRVPACDLVKGSLIPSIAARSYSIASCTDIVGNQIDLVVVVETWRNKLGETKSGLSSSYLSRLRQPHPAEGLMVTGNVVSSTALKITDYTKPCVMIGLGTGIAPFRAFIQKYFYERERHGVNTGDIVVYFGARTSSDEYLYGHELEQYKLWGVVSDLRLAFSRDPGVKKTYVQDLIKQDGDTLKRLIIQQQGYIMMCGPDWPVPTIHKSLGEMGIDVNEMMREGRYLEEVY